MSRSDSWHEIFTRESGGFEPDAPSSNAGEDFASAAGTIEVEAAGPGKPFARDQVLVESTRELSTGTGHVPVRTITRVATAGVAAVPELQSESALRIGTTQVGELNLPSSERRSGVSSRQSDDGSTVADGKRTVPKPTVKHQTTATDHATMRLQHSGASVAERSVENASVNVGGLYVGLAPGGAASTVLSAVVHLDVGADLPVNAPGAKAQWAMGGTQFSNKNEPPQNVLAPNRGVGEGGAYTPASMTGHGLSGRSANLIAGAETESPDEGGSAAADLTLDRVSGRDEQVHASGTPEAGRTQESGSGNESNRAFVGGPAPVQIADRNAAVNTGARPESALQRADANEASVQAATDARDATVAQTVPNATYAAAAIERVASPAPKPQFTSVGKQVPRGANGFSIGESFAGGQSTSSVTGVHTMGAQHADVSYATIAVSTANASQAASGISANNAQSDPFAVMDRAHSQVSFYSSAGVPDALRVGYHDPQLGYLEVDAQQRAGVIHASLHASTDAVSATLTSHLGPLGNWLQDRQTPVERLSVQTGGQDQSGQMYYGGSSSDPGTGQRGSNDAFGGSERSEDRSISTVAIDTPKLPETPAYQSFGPSSESYAGRISVRA